MSPAPLDPVAVAAGFADTLRARAPEIEEARRLPRDLSDAFAEAGLYRLLVPAAYGGHELPPGPVLRALETLATADGAAAWCVFIAVTSSVALARMPAAAARAVFDRPTVLLGGTFAPTGRAVPAAGGFRVTGRWAWGSGIQNADWVMGGCALVRNGEPERLANGTPRSYLMLAPARDVEILDTWYSAGLCGTGSTDFAMHDLLVPASHAIDLLGPPTVPAPLYAFPQLTLLAMGVGGVALGLGRAAIDELVGLAAGKTPQGSARTLAQRPATHAAVAGAEATLRAGRAFFYEAVEAAWAAACAGDGVSLAQRRDVRLATTHAVRAAVAAVDAMYDLGGGTSVYRRSPLQRIFRDVHTLTQHVLVAPATLEVTGRLLLGVETDATLL